MVTVIWKRAFMPCITLDIRWLLSYSDNSFTHAVTYFKIFSTLGAVKIVWFSDTPSFITEGSKPKDLDCFFSGWPFPLEVQWYKDGKIITNGTEGIYHSEDKKWKYGEETLRSTLHLPPGRVEQEGLYNCSAKNSIPGWKSEDSEIIQMIYKCKQKPITTYEVLMWAIWWLRKYELVK